MQDRFGVLPEMTLQLLEVLEIKLLARQLGLERIEQRGTEVRLTFHAATPLGPDRLLPWLASDNPGFRFQSEHVVCVPEPPGAPAERLARLKGSLRRLLASTS